MFSRMTWSDADDWGGREWMDVLLNLLKRYIFPSECLQMTLKRVIQIRCLVWRSLSTTTKPKLYLNHVGFAGAVEAPTGDGWMQVIGVQVAVRHPLWNWVTSHHPQDKPQVGNGYTFQIKRRALGSREFWFWRRAGRIRDIDARRIDRSWYDETA